MNKLTFKLFPKKKFKTIVEMNGEVISPSMDKSGYAIYTYETKENNIELRIYTEPNELLAHNWFLRYLYYYFISFLGLFDWQYSLNPYSFDYKATYTVTDNTIINFKWNKSNYEGAVFESPDVINNETNIYTYSKSIKRRYVGAILFKVASWLVILATIIICKIK